HATHGADLRLKLAISELQLLVDAGQLADLGLEPIDAKDELGLRILALPGGSRVGGVAPEHPAEQRRIVLRTRGPCGPEPGGKRCQHTGSKPIGDQANHGGMSNCRRLFTISAGSRPKCGFENSTAPKRKPAPFGAGCAYDGCATDQEVAPSTVTARRFCD